MVSQITRFLCGPFFYPVYFATLLHAFDFFVTIAPKSNQSQPPSPLRHPSAFASLASDSAMRPKCNHKEKK